MSPKPFSGFLWSPRTGHVEVARALLEAGVNIDLRDWLGMTALMHAALHGHVEIARLLLKAGADTNLKDILGKTRRLFMIVPETRVNNVSSNIFQGSCKSKEG